MVDKKIMKLSGDVLDVINEFEVKYNCKLLYLTKYGSKLYGTDNPNSDTDYKGIFVQAPNKVLLKQDLDHWTSNSNDTNEKNGAEDIDLQLFSVHKFFELVRKGETGALDILFSMFSPSVVYEDTLFTEFIRNNYKEFLNKKLHSFVGYAVGQATKYGIKGTRFKELQSFNEEMHRTGIMAYNGTKLNQFFHQFKAYFKRNNTKYLYMTRAQGPKTLKDPADIDYVEILGKKFSGDITVGYFFDKTIAMEEQFGNRARASTEGVDWKALSHSVRVLHEVEELLDTGFIQFPLQSAEFIKDIKENDNEDDLEGIMEYISTKIDEVKEKLENSNLPEKSDREFMDTIELKMFDRI